MLVYGKCECFVMQILYVCVYQVPTSKGKLSMHSYTMPSIVLTYISTMLQRFNIL